MTEPPTAENSVILCMRVADMPIPAFPDDQLGTCRDCGLPVRFRPYMPPFPKVCSRCMGLAIPE